MILKKKIKLDKKQRELAKEIGITEYTLSRILSGKQSCSKPVAILIAEKSNQKLEEIFIENKKIRKGE